LARELVERGEVMPLDREELEGLPGVGQYISNAVRLFGKGEPEPLLDVNMSRVLERYFGPRDLADIRYDPYLQALSRAVVDSDSPVDVNWAILDLGAMVCRSRTPLCDSCPLAQQCAFNRERQRP
jgi:A/G-specific adenine glycosylase